MFNYLDHLGPLKNAVVVTNDLPKNAIDEGASAGRSCVKNYSV